MAYFIVYGLFGISGIIIYKRCLPRYGRFFVISWEKVAAIVAWDAERPYFCTRFREVNTSGKQPHNESLPG